MELNASGEDTLHVGTVRTDAVYEVEISNSVKENRDGENFETSLPPASDDSKLSNISGTVSENQDVEGSLRGKKREEDLNQDGDLVRVEDKNVVNVAPQVPETRNGADSNYAEPLKDSGKIRAPKDSVPALKDNGVKSHFNSKASMERLVERGRRFIVLKGQHFKVYKGGSSSKGIHLKSHSGAI